MQVDLVLVRADGSSKTIGVPKLPARLGRGEDCALRVPLASVSRNHCELLEDEDEELIVRDLGSRNGTYVNGDRVSQRELIPGDVMAVGDAVFLVKIDGHPDQVDAKEAFAAGAVAADGASGGSPAQAPTRTPPSPAGRGDDDDDGADLSPSDLLAGIMDDDENDDSDFDLDLNLGGDKK